MVTKDQPCLHRSRNASETWEAALLLRCSIVLSQPVTSLKPNVMSFQFGWFHWLPCQQVEWYTNSGKLCNHIIHFQSYELNWYLELQANDVSKYHGTPPTHPKVGDFWVALHRPRSARLMGSLHVCGKTRVQTELQTLDVWQQWEWLIEKGLKDDIAISLAMIMKCRTS